MGIKPPGKLIAALLRVEKAKLTASRPNPFLKPSQVPSRLRQGNREQVRLRRMQELGLHIWQITSCQQLPSLVKLHPCKHLGTWRSWWRTCRRQCGRQDTPRRCRLLLNLFRPGDKCPEAVPQNFAAHLSITDSLRCVRSTAVRAARCRQVSVQTTGDCAESIR